MLCELKKKRENKERTDFRKAKEEAGRTISATSITQKKIMAALEKDLGVDSGRRTGLYIFYNWSRQDLLMVGQRV